MSCSAVACGRSSAPTARTASPVSRCLTTAVAACRPTWSRTSWSSATRCRGPPPARSTVSGSRSTAAKERLKAAAHGRLLKLESVINDYISREFVQDASLLPLGNATSLLETGILDSLGLLRLVVFVQERFGIIV